ncbi:MAG TPA: HD domain-containing protein [Spirochaetota bacterium]|nr:HD domain-containing protein [Spirochaetota bacterium]
MAESRNTQKVSIDLDYITADTSFVYPLYSPDGKKLLEEREVLSAGKIKNIRELYGSKLYYYLPGDRRTMVSGQIYHKAWNHTKKVLDGILTTEKFTSDAYKRTEEIINDIIEELKAKEMAVLTLIKDMRSFDEYLYNHSINVGMLTALLAQKKRIYKESEIKKVVIGAYLSDVGKMKLEKEVFNKPDKLSENELIRMRLHPQDGYNMLKGIREVDPVVLQTILFHHERFDDEGYYGLPYETLPSSPKIVSICDMYDALTSPRPFRKAYTASGALKIITSTIDKKYDRQLVSDFVNMAGSVLNNSQSFYRKGDFCQLNTGEISVISEIGSWDILKPKVIVFARFENSQNGSSLRFFNNPIEVDLSKDMNRKMDGILMHPKIIEAIKMKLKDKKMLLDYLYSSNSSEF